MESTLRTTLVTVSLLAFLGGCAKNKDAGDTAQGEAQTQDNAVAVVHLSAGQYAQGFNAARDVIRDMGFIMDRVDAQAGVMTTQPKSSAGLATPWDREQSSMGQEVEDALHRNRRVVRIECATPGSEESFGDIRTLSQDKPVEMTIAVPVYRWQVSGWRLNSHSVLASSYAYDPQLAERGMTSYGVAIKQDSLLAQRIAQKIEEQLSKNQAEAAVPPTQ